jgi:two-component system, NarL family, invasion response regulator UvrY
MRNPIRVLIADDHAIVREGLKQIVLRDGEIVVSGEAATGEEAIAKVRDSEFDVLVLDLSFPDRNGFDVLSHVKAARPELSVLILSMEREEEYAIRCLHAGASGYLEKRSAPEQLVSAIKRLAVGKKYISAELAERLALELDRPGVERPHDLLSKREFEIFLSIASGQPVSHIAGELGLSVKTVNNHRARILEKLGMKSTAEVIRYAIRHQLIR